MKSKLTPLARAIDKVPLFMHPETERIETYDDLLFQLAHEIDLAEDGNVDPPWTARELHRAKMYAATIKIAVEMEKLFTERSTSPTR